MRKHQPASGSYYHLFNRGVDRRCIFQDRNDYEKFSEYLYLFNDENYQNTRGDFLHNETLLAGSDIFQVDRVPYVKILSYCLMPNHFHLFVFQDHEKGIEKFLHKIGGAYTRFFNKKYQRSGSLFESTYKAVPVEKEGHFLHLPRYIHSNALDLAQPNWREGDVHSFEDAWRALEDYRWSSHHVYLGKEQAMPIVDVHEVKNLFSDPTVYLVFMKEWMSRRIPGDLVTTEI